MTTELRLREACEHSQSLSIMLHSFIWPAQPVILPSSMGSINSPSMESMPRLLYLNCSQLLDRWYQPRLLDRAVLVPLVSILYIVGFVSRKFLCESVHYAFVTNMMYCCNKHVLNQHNTASCTPEKSWGPMRPAFYVLVFYNANYMYI